MKRILLIILSLFLLIFVSGCKDETTNVEKQEVTINLPYDYSVNGFRNGESINTQNELSTEELDKIVEEILKNQQTTNQQSNIKEEEKETNSKTENKDNIEQKDPVESITTESTTKSYCGNKNSKVFHNSTCGSVSKMLDSNKVYLQNRDEFIQNGYTPCKRCNP